MIDDFARYQRRCGRSPTTVKRRTFTLNAFTRFIAPTELGGATLDDVERFLDTKVAVRTRHAYRSDLRVFYTWATSHGLVDRNPASEVATIRVPKSLPRPVRGARAALASGRLRTRRMVALELYAGLRCAEVAALDGADVDLRRGVLTVRNGKGAKDRQVDIHPDLAALLDGIPDSGPVFANRAGRPIRPAAVGATVKAHLARCGIDATAHQLRHTCATEMAYVTGGDLLAVQRFMGHGTMETTRGYAGWSGDGRAIVDRMFRDDGDAA